MKAIDVMVRDVVTVKPDDDIINAIQLLAKHDISALPVVEDIDTVVGVISEADLVRREEIGTEKHRRWWLEAITPGTFISGGSWARRKSTTRSLPWPKGFLASYGC